MAKIHTTLQGKGGVGKSLIATTIAQYKTDKGQTPLCIDTRSGKCFICRFLRLGVKGSIFWRGDEINTRNFDTLIEMIASSTDDVVIDNGASSFVPLSHYLISNDVPILLKSIGHELVVHTVVTGGQSLLDTVSGFSQLTKQFPEETIFVVWLNPLWGPVESEGKNFQEMKAYRDNKDKVSAIIEIPSLKAETFGIDLTEMLQERLTFNEAINHPDVQ